MARIRTVKPEAWHSEQLCAVSRDARLLWVVLVTMSDDEGRFRLIPAAVIGHGFPVDEDAPELLQGWLAELAKEGLIVMYRNGRSVFGCHPNWRSHQRINKATASKLPAPDHEDSEVIHVALRDSDGSTPVGVTDDYRGEGIKEGSGSEGMATAARASATGDLDWFDRCVAAGQAKRSPWASDLMTLAEQRSRCDDLFSATTPEIANAVRRDVLDAVAEGKVRNQLPNAVRAFIGQAEKRATEPVRSGPRLVATPKLVDDAMAAKYGEVGS